MQFYAFTALDRGQQIDRTRAAWPPADAVKGLLWVADVNDQQRHRTVKTAALRDLDNRDLLIPLKDVQLVAVRPNAWTLTGTETVGKPPRDFAQSWILIPVDFIAENQSKAAEVKAPSGQVNYRRSRDTKPKKPAAQIPFAVPGDSPVVEEIDEAAGKLSGLIPR